MILNKMWFVYKRKTQFLQMVQFLLYPCWSFSRYDEADRNGKLMELLKLTDVLEPRSANPDSNTKEVLIHQAIALGMNYDFMGV